MASSPSTAAERREPGRAPLAATVELPGEDRPATLAAASRLSLAVTLAGPAPAAAVDGVHLRVELPGGEVRLGPARLSPGPGGGPARLVFTEHLHDCRVLVDEGRVVDLRSWFENVPVVLGQKDRVRPEFRAHVADAAYDLAVWRRFFDEQDQILEAEPPEVAEAAREALRATEGRRFLDFLDEKVAQLGALVQGFTTEEHERHGFYLRRHLWPYISASAFMRRTNLKPRGYAGDAELMVMIYEQRHLGASTFDQLMHDHGIQTAAAEAVRNRRSLVPRLLREAQARARSGAARLRIMSLACGPAWELGDVFLAPGDLARFEVSLLDQDAHALELARATVGRVEARLGGPVAVRYHQDSVRTMLRTRDLEARFGAQDFIYSMGLFDYLTAPVARAVLARMYALLAPGGVLVVGNFHARTPTRLHMDYWGDWPLTYRTEDSFLALAEGLDPAACSVGYDATGCQMFLRLEKGG